MDRRAVLMSAGAWGILEAASRFSDGRAYAQGAGDTVETFAPDNVKRAAERLAAKEFSKPKIDLPEPFNKLTYDQYRDIRFRTDRAIWRGENIDFELQLFPIGFLFDIPVEIWVVEGGRARLLKADQRLFTLGPLVGQAEEAAPFAFSGFRIHGPINRSDYFDEYAVFQGASYFRAVARGQVYGMSARGLAINTAQASGEEFPFFRAFWIEKPTPGASAIVVHALLDSPSTTGAYRFTIQPGPATLVDVDVTLYPRRSLTHVGLAPLTSMFLYGAANRRIYGDFRPAVHDSEGLAILNGRGERLWRPLTNPRKLQTSAFVDKDPKGYGLCQRDRSFRNFEDLEAMYGRRPTVWVEPRGGWGEGFVELIEIPAEEEIHDNIAVYWKPARPLEAGRPYAYAYRLNWADAVPAASPGARVNKTLVGTGRKAGTVFFAVDFEGPALKELRDMPVPELSASAGSISNLVVVRHSEIMGVRVTFNLNTGGTELIELRLGLKSGGQLISESWLYRWTKA